MRHQRLTLAAALTLSLFAIPATRATTLAHLDTRTLTRSSPQIVIGRVVVARAHWNEAHTRIVTDVDVAVSETLKGVPAERVTLTQLGGEVDGVKVSVAGCAAFRPGEEALLFVWRDARGHAQLTGLAQGKFEIERDPRTGVRMVQRRTPGFEVGDVRTLKSVRAGIAARRLTLDELVREVRAAMAEGGGR